jgi:gluconate 5-dehydrogenase
MPYPLFDLTGRRALITGSSQGLGLAIARGLAEAGATVILNGRDTAKLARATAELTAAGLSASNWAFDVTNENEVIAAIGGIGARDGAIDILVNNAGIHRRSPLTDMTLADWDAVLRANLTSAFLVTRAVVPGMIQRGRGKIINLCSVISEVARPTIGNYAAAKGGLKMLTRSMAVEWGRHNVQANGIGPGYMLTDLNTGLAADPKFDAWIKGRTPAGRWGQPGEVAGAAVFLAAPASDFVNGHVLYVDGGVLAAL